MFLRFSIGLLLLIKSTVSFAFSVEGVIRLSSVSNNAQPSFFDKGNGIFRSDGNDLLLSQAILSTQVDVGKSLVLHSVANAYSDGDKQLGLTQAYLEYRPLSPGVFRWSSRAGLFYPRLSVENTDVGWLANHFITSSALNSWIGEELRVPGLELSLHRSGRKAKSPWSFRFDLGAYKGNDTTGTLLTWRGFAIHDRQTLHHERVEFAPLPSVISPDYFNAPSWTEPFTEVDGKVGFYVGAQAQYVRKLDIRYFIYDNRANPLKVNEQRLYAWHTKFHSLATRYLMTPNLTLSLHLMDGATEMGSRLVYADFRAAYGAFSYTQGAHKYSVRLDLFDVKEDDLVPKDYNDSHGHALTINWTYRLSNNWQVTAEGIYTKHRFENRPSLAIADKQRDYQGQLAMTYRF
ncbi:hypothetical protein DRW07_18150 [Alteromonas sediminis]|uniref:Porin n=1 Tax=Alteromonas sediminis TaxID=2259342 RepID=A0A3N5XY91_9ALTE|nr:hypothetical protein [Alteromonas sediminis]RPJ64846.1 hypothetical protein DRW07_18150 [Alteromonas sediminis]